MMADLPRKRRALVPPSVAAERGDADCLAAPPPVVIDVPAVPAVESEKSATRVKTRFAPPLRCHALMKMLRPAGAANFDASRCLGTRLAAGEACSRCGSQLGGWVCRAGEFGYASCYEATASFALADLFGHAIDRATARVVCFHGTDEELNRAVRHHCSLHVAALEAWRSQLADVLTMSRRGQKRKHGVEGNRGCRPDRGPGAIPEAFRQRLGILQQLAASRSKENLNALLCQSVLSPAAVGVVGALASCSGSVAAASPTAAAGSAALSGLLAQRRGHFYTCPSGGAAQLLAMWHGRDGEEWASYDAYQLLLPSCGTHGGASCWRRCSGPAELMPARAFASKFPILCAMSPRFASKADLSRAASRTCFCKADVASSAGFLSVPAAEACPARTLTPRAARSLQRLVPARLLWYCVDGVLGDVRALKCPRCKQGLRLLGVSSWAWHGIGTSCLFRPLVPALRCKAASCGQRVTPLDSNFADALPVGAQSTFRWDRAGQRILECSLTDACCLEMRRRFQMAAVRSSVATRIAQAWAAELDDGPEVASEIKPFLQHYLSHAVPTAKFFGDLAVKVFQLYEQPVTDMLVADVVRAFGWVHLFDGSSAPLRQCRPVERGRRGRQSCPYGAALALHGVDDVPLLPAVLVKREGNVELAQLSGYALHLLRLSCPEASILGLIDDDLEHTFASSIAYLRAALAPEIGQGVIRLMLREKRVEGFWRGTDPKHVQWRLQDRLARSSCDFPLAVQSLQVLFGRLNGNEFCARPARVAGATEAIRASTPAQALETFQKGRRLQRDPVMCAVVVESWVRGGLRRSHDRARPPRCYVTLLLKALGADDPYTGVCEPRV